MILGPIRWGSIVGRPVWKWADVTGTSPLELTIDGEDDPLEVEPDVLAHVGTLSLSDRVYVQIIPGGAVVVHGKA